MMRNYFYLKWTNISSPEYEAVWLHDKPSKINFINQVKCDYIKKGFKFYICGYFPDYENDEFTVCKENKYNNIHFLKSHLQKNIRRKDCKRAIPTALHLMKLDMNEFLRRKLTFQGIFTCFLLSSPFCFQFNRRSLLGKVSAEYK